MDVIAGTIFVIVILAIIFGPPILYFLNERKKTVKSNFGWIGFTLLWFLVIGFCIAVEAPCLLNARQSAYENRCKLTLRALSTAEKAWFDKKGSYGTYEELLKENYITPEWLRDSLNDNYSFIIFDVNKNKKAPSFTIIAIPRTRQNRLRTFAICEDENPRVWIGQIEKWEKYKTSLHEIKYWESLR